MRSMWQMCRSGRTPGTTVLAVQPLTAPVLVAAGLLVAGGAPKVLRPDPARLALRSVGLRVPGRLVRVGGAAEAVVGVVALVGGGRVAVALLAASYAGFTAFLALALRRGGVVSSCGCVGRADTPPTVPHAVLTGLLAVLAAAAAASGTSGGLLGLAALPAGTAVVVAALSALAGWLGWLVLTALPHVLRSPVRPA